MSISSQKPSLQQEARSGDPARTEERYALAMQSINYAVYDADLEGGEVYFSESLRKMLGMRPDDPAYTTGNIIETIHPDDRPILSRGDRRAFQGRHAAIRGRLPVSRRSMAAGAGAASME